MAIKYVDIAILISDKTDFKTKAVTGKKEGHFLMITESIKQKDLIQTFTYPT